MIGLIKSIRWFALVSLAIVLPCCGGGSGGGSLPGVTNLKVIAGAGSAELSWTSTPGAVNYLIKYSASPIAKADLPSKSFGVAYASTFLQGAPVSVSTSGRIGVVLGGLPPGTAYFDVSPIFGAGTGSGTDSGSTPLLQASQFATGGGPLAFAGWSVMTVGDLDGDKQSDFIVGAPAASPGGRMNAGSAFVYSGSTGALLYQKDGTTAGDYLGVSVAGAGDVNGDGVPDFIIGASQAASGSLLGIVYVYSGSDGTLIHQKNGSSLTDVFELGCSVAAAGDVNGDGKGDFVAGAFFSSPGGIPHVGSAFVFSGIDGSALFRKDGEAENNSFGASVSGGADINGDGVPDFIVGAPNYDVPPGIARRDGAVYVYSGSNGALIYKRTGDIAYGDFHLGTSVSAAGDLDGDGRADFMAGAPFGNPGGTGKVGVVRVYSGVTGDIIRQFHGDVLNDQLGYSVCAAGDVNADGYSDVLAGGLSVPGVAGTGKFRVFSGVDGTVLYEIQGQATDAGFGMAIGTAGDINGDGNTDFIVGAPSASVASIPNSGAAYVYNTSNELGIIPSESVNPFSLDGFGAMNMPVVAPSGTKTLAGSGGTSPFTWTLLTNNSGGSLGIAGLYTAGSTNNVYDTIRVTDSIGRSHDTRVLVNNGVNPSIPPKRPTELLSILVTATQIDLSWTDAAPNETGYLIEFRTPTNTWSTAVTKPANATTHSMTGLDADKMYLFRIKAFNNTADSSWSPLAISTLQFPSSLAATPVSSTQVDLTWTDQSSAEEGFQIEYRTTASGASWVSVGSVGENTSAFSVTGLVANTSYEFRVRAFAQVIYSAWTPSTGATTPP